MTINNLQKEKMKAAADEFIELHNGDLELQNSQYRANYSIKGYNVNIWEQSIDCINKNCKKVQIAKATYVFIKKKWKLYCMNKKLRWSLCLVEPEHDNIESVFKCIDENAYGEFFK